MQTSLPSAMMMVIMMILRLSRILEKGQFVELVVVVDVFINVE